MFSLNFLSQMIKTTATGTIQDEGPAVLRNFIAHNATGP